MAMYFQLAWIPQSRISGSIGDTIFTVLKKYHYIPKLLCHFKFPPTMYEAFQFPHMFIYPCPTVYEVVFHCGFDTHFPDDQDVEHAFMCLFAFLCLLCRSVFSDPLPIFNSHLSYYYQLTVICMYSRPKCSLRYLTCKYFLLGSQLSFHFFYSVFWGTKVLILMMKYILSILSFVACAFGV